MAVRPEAVIYTDGSCLGNPGPGGWASIILVDGTEQQISGGDASTTNNRMELLGVINGLKSLRGPHIVTIYTDSQYITNAFNKHWLQSWKRNGWARKDGPLKNVELWRELDSLTQKHICTFSWVKGHNGNHYNELCDKLAVSESRKYSKEESELADPADQEPEDDALEALESYIRTTNREIYGVDAPCGSLPFCDFCMGGDVRCICAKAYMGYWREARKESR